MSIVNAASSLQFTAGETSHKRVGFMHELNIFVSFEYDKDKSLKGSFFSQAKDMTTHRVRNSSLEEAHPEQQWKDKATTAIRKCDIVVVLVGLF